MFFDFELSGPKLAGMIRYGVEQNLMVRDIGLSGLLPNVPFATNLIALLNNEADPATVAIDHLRVTDVSLSTSSSTVPVTLNVPPRLSLPFLPPAPAAPPVTVEAPLVDIAVTFDVHLVKLDDLVAADGSPVPPGNTMVVQCRANCTLPPPVITDGILNITPSVVDLELGLFGFFMRLPPVEERLMLDPGGLLPLFRRRNRWAEGLTDDQLGALLRLLLQLNDPGLIAHLNLPPIPLNISGITSVLGSLSVGRTPLVVWNVGLYADPTRMVVRLQVEPSGLIDPSLSVPGLFATFWTRDWTSFYRGASTSRLGSHGWSIFFPSSAFIDAFHKGIMDGAAADTRFDISAGGEPRSEWQIDGGTPDAGSPCSARSRVRIVTRFAIFLPHACEPTGLGIDVNIRLTTVLSLRGNSKLRADVHLDYTPDEGDVALCSIVNSLVGSVAGFIAGAPAGIVGAAIAAAVAAVVAGVATIVVAATYDPGELSLGSRLSPVPGSDRDFCMEFPFDADLSLRGARIDIRELAACPDGLCIRGPVTAYEMELLLAGDLVHRAPFDWSGMGLCTVEGLVTAATFLQWDLHRSRVGFVDMPLTLFQFTILDANPVELRSFAPDLTLEHSTGMVLTVRTDSDQALGLTAAATAAGISDSFISVFIQTNVGARVIRLEPFDGTLTRGSFDDYSTARSRFCALTEMFRRARREPSPFRALLDRSDIRRKLTVQPMPGARVMSLWTAMADGLHAGDTLRVGRASTSGAAAMELIHEFGAPGKVALARALEYTHKADSRLLLELKTAQSNGGTLMITWEYFHEKARIPYWGKRRDLAIDSVNGEPYLALLAETGLDVYSLATSQPRLVFASALVAERLSWQRGMLVVEGADNAYYDPMVNRLSSLPFRSLPNSPPARRRYEVIDDQGQSLTIEPFGKLSILMDNRVPHVAIFERYDRKEPDPLLP